jgi:pimeloyl-ACP methyl ester carboxylesterase
MELARGGEAITYDVVGDGPALLLLHAFPLDRRMWRDTASRLSARHRVITMDLRGFGGSTLRRPASLEDFAGDAAAVLDAVGVPMATALGLSMGGHVALAFARLHAARLSALVLADTRAGADSAEGKRARDEGIAAVQSRGVAAYVAPMVDRLLSPAASAIVREETRALMAQQRAEAIANGLAAMRDRPDRTGELAAILVPTLIVRGSEDAVTGEADMREMAAQIRGARFCSLAGAGHLANLEQPAPFAEAVAGFLDDVFVD